jgi:hypothetical protein
MGRFCLTKARAGSFAKAKKKRRLSGAAAGEQSLV